MRKHLSTKWEVRGQEAAYTYFDKHIEMSRQLLLEVARGMQYRARLTNDTRKNHFADGFYTILSTLAMAR